MVVVAFFDKGAGHIVHVSVPGHLVHVFFEVAVTFLLFSCQVVTGGGHQAVAVVLFVTFIMGGEGFGGLGVILFVECQERVGLIYGIIIRPQFGYFPVVGQGGFGFIKILMCSSAVYIAEKVIRPQYGGAVKIGIGFFQVIDVQTQFSPVDVVPVVVRIEFDGFG